MRQFAILAATLLSAAPGAAQTISLDAHLDLPKGAMRYFAVPAHHDSSRKLVLVKTSLKIAANFHQPKATYGYFPPLSVFY